MLLVVENVATGPATVVENVATEVQQENVAIENVATDNGPVIDAVSRQV